MYTPTEILNDIDKTFNVAGPGTVAGNQLTLTINGQERKRHYIGSFILTDTAGTGGNEKLTIKIGAKIVWEETFNIGEDKVRQFPVVPLVSSVNEEVRFEVTASELTAGKLYVVYYTK